MADIQIKSESTLIKKVGDIAEVHAPNGKVFKMEILAISK